MRAHLTEVGVRALKVRDGQYRVWDSSTRGFGVLVGGQAKSWIVMYGKNRRLKVLGRYPDVPLADARKAAKKLLLDNSATAPTPKFGEALERYYALHFPTLRASTAYARKGTLERHFRQWEKKELGELTAAQILRVVDALLDTPVERHNAFKELRCFYRWCIGRQHLKNSPCEGLKGPPRGPSRERVLTDQELVAVWKAADQTAAPFGPIVKILILTGQRRGEVAKLRGEYFDRLKRTITLPSTLTKNKREHTFPYGDMVAGVVADMAEVGWLFPARCKSHKPFNGFAACKAKLDKKAKVDFDIHDLRRTFATKLAELGISPHIVERLLNHMRGDISAIAAIYNRHSYLPEMRAAIERWEAHLTAILATERDAQAA